MTIRRTRSCRRAACARPLDGDPAIVSGPSGCAGLAGLMRVCTDEAASKALGLDRTAACC